MKETLRIKTYFASSVEAALGLARRELGPDAMLLNTRQSPPEARHLGMYEAVFATLPENADAEKAAASPLRAVPPSSSIAPESLEKAGIDPNLAQKIAAAQPASVADHMETLVTADPVLARASKGSEVAALIGPTGRGKTTTLVKLAVTHGLAMHKPVRIFSADYLRAAAPVPLRTLAGILGVTFESFGSPATLDNALRQPLPGLTLIDTPGFGPRDHEAASALARCLTSHPDVQSHLVLRADSAAAALDAAIERFSFFRPASLLFTGLDEVVQAGSMFSAAVHSRIPVSFLCNGQSIPEDIEPASAARIVELALGPFSRHARQGAAAA